MREVLDPSTFPGALAYAVLFFGTAAVVARLIRTSVKAATLACGLCIGRPDRRPICDPS